MDRRQVDDVEAHRGDRGQPRLRFAERAAARRVASCTERGNISYQAPNRARTGRRRTVSTRSYVVDALRSAARPSARASAGSLAAHTRATCGCVAAQQVGDPEESEILVCTRAGPASRIVRRGRRRRAAAANRPPLRAARSRRPDPASAFATRRLQPRAEAVDPRFDRVLVLAKLGHGERRVPAIVVARRASSSTEPRCHVRTRPMADAPRDAAGPPRRVAVPPWRDPVTCRYFTTPASMSWPSAKMSAVTVTCSPTLRLIGKRPPSISGQTRSTMTRAAIRRSGSVASRCVAESLLSRASGASRRGSTPSGGSPAASIARQPQRPRGRTRGDRAGASRA